MAALQAAVTLLSGQLAQCEAARDKALKAHAHARAHGHSDL